MDDNFKDRMGSHELVNVYIQYDFRGSQLQVINLGTCHEAYAVLEQGAEFRRILEGRVALELVPKDEGNDLIIGNSSERHEYTRSALYVVLEL